MLPGKASDMGFVDKGLMPWRLQQGVALPVEFRIDDDPERRTGGIVGFGERQVGFGRDVAKHTVGPGDAPAQCTGVRVQDNLVGVESMTGVRDIRTVDTVSVQLSRSQVGKIPVPDLVCLFRERDPMGLNTIRLGIEQAQINRSGVLGKDREVDSLAVPGRTERVWLTWPDTEHCAGRGHSRLISGVRGSRRHRF